DYLAAQSGERQSIAVGRRERERGRRPDLRQGLGAPGVARERRRCGKKDQRKRRDHANADAPHGQPFSSFLSSLKSRQSVPWARIFWGSLLITRISRSRSDWKRTASPGSSSRHARYGTSFMVCSAYS